jgi:hypothetical protein
MMPLGFCEVTDFLHKKERLKKVSEAKGTLDAVGVIHDCPMWRLCMKTFGLIAGKGRDATTARSTSFFSKRLCHEDSLVSSIAMST